MLILALNKCFCCFDDAKLPPLVALMVRFSLFGNYMVCFGKKTQLSSKWADKGI